MMQKSKTIFPEMIKVSLRNDERRFLEQIRKDRQTTFSDIVREMIRDSMKIHEKIQ